MPEINVTDIKWFFYMGFQRSFFNFLIKSQFTVNHRAICVRLGVLQSKHLGVWAHEGRSHAAHLFSGESALDSDKSGFESWVNINKSDMTFTEILPFWAPVSSSETQSWWSYLSHRFLVQIKGDNACITPRAWRVYATK